jgi:aspartyl-tRNA(Asn)/glutamyl-tRNA(Gln) amidotransferase subunit A
MYLSDIFTIPVNLAGLPGLSLPGGVSRTGLPIGVHLIGPPLGEEKIFSAAYALESEIKWERRIPEL